MLFFYYPFSYHRERTGPCTSKRRNRTARFFLRYLIRSILRWVFEEQSGMDKNLYASLTFVPRNLLSTGESSSENEKFDESLASFH